LALGIIPTLDGMYFLLPGKIMLNFITIFDARDLYVGLFLEILYFLSTWFTIGLILYILSKSKEFYGKNRFGVRLFTIFPIIMAILFIFGLSRSYLELKESLRNNTFLVVEGNIRNLKGELRTRYWESFDIKGVHFSYSEYHPEDGFHIFLPTGTWISNGRYVRITYSPNRIVRIDVKKCGKEISFSDRGEIDCVPEGGRLPPL
jgi:hypothetical protein